MTSTAPGGETPNRFESVIARWERTWTSVILVAVMVVQVNGLLHHAFMGQDWGMSPGFAAEAIRQPPPRWIVYITTNPPGLFWLCGLVQFLTGTTMYIAATSFVLVGFNLLALGVWARIGRAIIRQPSLRMAALLALSFLPVRVVHSTVFASDALAVLPFTLAIWLLIDLFRPAESRRQLKIVLATSVVMFAGIYSKYTIASALPVVLALLIVLGHHVSSRRIRVAALVLLVVLPGAFTALQYRNYAAVSSGPGRQRWAHEMEWRSLLMLRAADRDVLDAPNYDERITLAGVEDYNLLIKNRHSYPALLHLSTFTDVMNIYQYDPNDSYFGVRDKLHKRLMALSVRVAIPLSLLMLVAVVTYLFRIPSQIRRFRGSLEGRGWAVTIVLSISVAFFANIAVFLPAVQFAYFYGYWDARLVLPPLMGFCFLGFVLLDERLRSGAARAVVLAFVVAQAVLHVSFLWPRGP